jgi:hypothetical protein
MTDLDLYTAIAIFIVSSLQILHHFSQETNLSKWLSPFSIGWILSGLAMALPMVQKGSLVSVAAVYLLLGALIVNTLVLSACSRLPAQLIAFKSPTIEQVGAVFVELMGRGLSVVLRELATALFRFIDAMLAQRPKMPRLQAA